MFFKTFKIVLFYGKVLLFILEFLWISMFRNKTYEAYPNTTLKKQLMSMINPTSLTTVKSITLFHGYQKR